MLDNDPHGNTGASAVIRTFTRATHRTNRATRIVHITNGGVTNYLKYRCYFARRNAYIRGSSVTSIVRSLGNTSVIIFTSPVC